jgi:hypothetical protein
MAGQAMVTAASKRSRRFLATAVIAAAAASGVLAGCAAAAPAAQANRPGGGTTSAGAIAPGMAPAGWHRAALPDGGAVLAYPPDMHQVPADAGEVSAARTSPSGAFLLYLNATPRQGDETLRNWPAFRVAHLTDDDATSARLIAASHHVRFLGGTGTCVTDSYVTKAKAHHFTEMACFVQGKTSASVVVATAPTANWRAAAPVLKRAVAAYQVR